MRQSRLARPVLAPSQAAMRRIALAGVVASTGIIATGAAVRLSQSGLGCPDWPRCTAGSLVATRVTGQSTANTWIEFGNRLLTVALMVVAVLVFAAAWQFRTPGRDGRRTDLVWLAAAQPAGVVLQAVLGGIAVLTKLNPAVVSVHFLASIAMVGAAVLLHVRCAAIPAAASAPPVTAEAAATGPGGSAGSLVRPDLRLLSGILVGVTCVMLAAGTVVTGTGPLAGNAAAHRYHLPLAGVTQLHADIGWLISGLAVALVFGLRMTGAPPRAVRQGWILIGAIGLQGIIGYIQYFTRLPAGLVGVHVLGSVLVWIAALRLFLVTGRTMLVP
jgi:cytochrome c oxidase assembly protein subunit 15